ncbi:MAG: 3'(2'),5'-bisphosphate nucleotidase CysQ [Tropicimonas sp.]|uniref:3'(2'),5'-bisphosphate nucleotidase CysQ n=1 Tax=Tropicimonas sp. TaxID=2067044 RepID=UPI003A8C06B9
MPDSDLSLLVAAASAAGEVAQRHFRAGNTVWEKADGQGPVTEADLEVDAMLRERLMAARPGYGWLSEESEDDAARLACETVFIVDPIDGTRAFIEGSRTWAHSLAVIRQGRPVAAVVCLPMLDKLYTARVGGGARLNGAPIHASSRTGVQGADLLAARSTFNPRYWTGGAPDVTRHFRSSLAYRLALVGEGRFDGMITLRNSWEWDIAAGALIAAEAGATVSDRTGAAISFNTVPRFAAGIICAAPGVHAGLLARLNV